MSTGMPKSADRAFNREKLSGRLFEGVSALQLQLDQRQLNQLLDYLALLHKWNAVYNLTAIREPEAMITQHLLDSLAVVPAFYESRRVLDVGSGGGLPGMVLAIVRPDLEVEMIDVVKKKTAFLSQVKSELGLSNVAVHAGRVERHKSDRPFDTITSRAFASLGEMVQLSQHLLAPSGRYIAMKGAVPTEEIDGLPPGWKTTEARRILVPGLEAERHLIIIERVQE